MSNKIEEKNWGTKMRNKIEEQKHLGTPQHQVVRIHQFLFNWFLFNWFLFCFSFHYDLFVGIPRHQVVGIHQFLLHWFLLCWFLFCFLFCYDLFALTLCWSPPLDITGSSTIFIPLIFIPLFIPLIFMPLFIPLFILLFILLFVLLFILLWPFCTYIWIALNQKWGTKVRNNIEEQK